MFLSRAAFTSGNRNKWAGARSGQVADHHTTIRQEVLYYHDEMTKGIAALKKPTVPLSKQDLSEGISPKNLFVYTHCGVRSHFYLILGQSEWVTTALRSRP
jgi:hypothetical protein